MQPPNFIFLGLSGSGKGTQEEKLKAYLEPRYKMRIISTGKILREIIDLPTETGRRIKETLSHGDLMPEPFAIMAWMHEAVFHVQEAEGIIFDGSPRKVDEAREMDWFLEFVGRKDTTRVVYLKVSPEEVTRRLLLRQRHDDTEEGIKGRISYFYDEVLKTLDYYGADKRVIEVNGEQPVENVFRDLLRALNL